MAAFDYDLFVIGGGSGGVRAARRAAQHGAKVALVEAAALGGTCVNVGCIPKKLYSYAAHFSDDFRDAAGFGWELGDIRFDWARLKAHRAKEIHRLNAVYEHLLRTAGVELFRGWAQLGGDHAIDVQSASAVQRHTARHILIASGATSSVPHFPGREHVVTSDSMFDLEPFPERLLVVGGGYIACEFASIFNGLGSHVTQLYRGEQILRGFDDEVRDFIAGEMRKHGIDVRLRSQVAHVAKAGAGLVATLHDGSTLTVDSILYATGRVPNVRGLGLERLGIDQGPHGQIVVDAHYRSSVPWIYALGDVTARMQLTPVALAEAMTLADQIFGGSRATLDYENIPTAVFTHPNVAVVGLTETQARERFGTIRVFRSEFRPLKHTLSGSDERAFMKLVVDAASDRVVGMHMVGAEAGEIVQGFAVALKAGATKAVFDATVGIHPTAAEEWVTMREPVVARSTPD